MNFKKLLDLVYNLISMENYLKSNNKEKKTPI